MHGVFESVTPVAARATGKQGTFPPVLHNFQHIGQCCDEMDAFNANNLHPKISAAEYIQLKVSLRQMIDTARRGKIVIDIGRDPDAKTLGDRFVYELRPRYESRLVLHPRLVRLYCAEPKDPEKLILGLCLATKPGDHADLAREQNQSIGDAENRANAWAMSRLTGRLTT